MEMTSAHACCAAAMMIADSRPHGKRIRHAVRPDQDPHSLSLANRIVMSPMTRSRAVEANMPNALMAEYYGQRASAGLIVTEGTSPSPNGLGYPRIPGLLQRRAGRRLEAGDRRGARQGRQDRRAADAYGPRHARGQPARGRRDRRARRSDVVPARCTPTRRACSATPRRAR